jgi:hypothetical protein
LLNGVHLLNLKSASAIPLVVWVEAAIGGVLLSFAYERVHFNLLHTPPRHRRQMLPAVLASTWPVMLFGVGQAVIRIA